MFGRVRRCSKTCRSPSDVELFLVEHMPILSEARSENVPPSKAAKTEITTLRVKRLSDQAVLPKRGSAKAAGYDLSRQDWPEGYAARE